MSSSAFLDLCLLFDSARKLILICSQTLRLPHILQDHRSWKEPTKLFESMVVVGLHPNCDIQALQRQCFLRKSEGPGKLRSALGYQNQSRVGPSLEPQVLIIRCIN